MDTELGTPTADRGHAPPGVAATMSVERDLGEVTAERGYPAPAVAAGMAVDAVGDPVDLAEPTPDRGSAPPAVAQGFSTWSPEQLFEVVRAVADIHTAPDRYAAVVIDRPADGSSAEGLRAGIGLFGQASGELGQVLRLMRDRDAAAFGEAFGGHSETLLNTLTAAEPEARLAPVGGVNLWEGQWPQGFIDAAALPSYQYAQNEFAIEGRLRPIEGTAERLGLPGITGIALVYERVVAWGPELGLRWINRVLGEAPDGSAYAVLRLRAASTQAGRRIIDQLVSSPALAAADGGSNAGDLASR